MSFSWLGSRQQTKKLGELLNALYRIDKEELHELFREHYAVNLIHAEHVFHDPPEKTGAEGVVNIFESKTRSFSGRPFFRADSITIDLNETECRFRYHTSIQEFSVIFAGTPQAVEAFTAALKSEHLAFATVFIYVFNRFRASRALETRAEEERSFVQSIYKGLRESHKEAEILNRIAKETGFDLATCCLLGTYTNFLVPISFDEHIQPVAVSDLSFWNTIADSEEGAHLVSLSETVDCNCTRLYGLGMRQACFVRIGRDVSGGTSYPRGVLALYRKKPTSIQPGDLIVIEYAARELAAWVDELDENVEHDIVKRAITVTEQYCAAGLRSSIDTSVFDVVLRSVGDIISRSISSVLPFCPGSPVQCGFRAESREFGDVPNSASVLFEIPHTHHDTELQFIRSDSTGSMVCMGGRAPKQALFVSSTVEILTFLRPHVIEWLFNLMALVFHLLRLEDRRTTWINRTIHEVRHPMQGLITMGSEIGRLARKSSVPRSEIAKYAEDMEVSIMRLKVMLEIFENIAGLDKVCPNPRQCFIEADVLRPIRRLLSGHARKRHITISDTYGFDVIGAVVSDPDLLTLVFYNLIDNAIKYGDPETKVTIACEVADDYQITVTNTGQPISEADAAHIFENHFRGSNVRDKEVGLGIGLYLARHLARKLNCQLDLVDGGRLNGQVAFCLAIPK